MAEVKVTLTPFSLRLSPEALISMAKKHHALNEEQARHGISSTGAPFPPGKGKKHPLDMHDSGRMFADVSFSPHGWRANAPYAGDVDAVYHWMGLSPSFAKRWQDAIQEDIQRGLKTEER